MFTGIVAGTFPVKTIENKPGLMTFSVALEPKYAEGLQLGASVAVDGVCFTVAGIQNNIVIFDAMLETLRRTTLQFLQVGTLVNIERSAKLGDEIGGHQISGHVYGVVPIVACDEPENNKCITVKLPLDWMHYVIEKGFITLDGCSLTIVNSKRDEGTFEVWLIPETLQRTSFGRKTVGDLLNLEFDPMTQYIVDTVERVMMNGTE